MEPETQPTLPSAQALFDAMKDPINGFRRLKVLPEGAGFECMTQAEQRFTAPTPEEAVFKALFVTTQG